jgi:hypothetical protein
MKRKIHVETSIISDLTARPSNDSIKSACQQIMLQFAAWEDL